MSQDLITVEIPRFVTALAQWSAALLPLFLLKRRFHAIAEIFINAAFLAADLLFMMLTQRFISGMAMFGYNLAAAAMLMALQIYSSCKVRLADLSEYAGFSFTLAELISCISWFFCGFLWYRQKVSAHLPGILAVTGCCVGAILTLMYFLLRKYFREEIPGAFRTADRILVPVISMVFLTVSNVCLFLSIGQDWAVLFMASLSQMLVDFLGAAVQYVFITSVFSIRAEREMIILRSLMQSQHDQYLREKESMELLQIRYHDLKHQIEYLKALHENGHQREYLEKMEAQLDDLEMTEHTGNPVLDTILTGKEQYCSRHGIEFTCVADGTLLSFMEEADLCTLIGNILDNAIEASEKVEDPEKRMIHLTLKKKGNFAALCAENYFESDIPDLDHLETSKTDKSSHGFGIRSIRRTAENYGGILTLSAENSWFRLCVLLPSGQTH